MSEVNQEVDYKVDLSNPPVKKEDEEVKDKATDEVQNEDSEESEVEEQEEVVEDNKSEDKPDEEKEKPEQETEVKLSKEEIIAQFLTDKYSIGVDELENVLLNKDKKTQELPEEVEKYLQYKNETKRGLKDFVKANEDVSEYEETTLLREYYKQSNPELDDADIDYLIEDKFTIDDNIDTDRDAKRKSLEKKQELHKAKQYFEQIKDKYKAPLESSTDALPDDVKKAVEFYQQYNDESAKQQEVTSRQREIFEKKTSEFFNEKFEGFEFNLGDKKLNYTPKNVNEVVKQQSDLNNFISKYLDSDGNLSDPKKYHSALNMAMNPEAYAKFFYEQGKADAVNEVVKDGKNIKMDVRANVDSSKPGAKFKVVNDSNNFGRGLKIRKK